MTLYEFRMLPDNLQHELWTQIIMPSAIEKTIKKNNRPSGKHAPLIFETLTALAIVRGESSST